jgi:hypothetical protein
VGAVAIFHSMLKEHLLTWHLFTGTYFGSHSSLKVDRSLGKNS